MSKATAKLPEKLVKSGSVVRSAVSLLSERYTRFHEHTHCPTPLTHKITTTNTIEDERKERKGDPCPIARAPRVMGTFMKRNSGPSCGKQTNRCT